jgi:sterol desaturase/sphingolipid hydroxylase (fatty acid hydroxylase superfamily)
MEKLISYFSDLEKRPLERAGFFIAGMVLLWLIENAAPLINMNYKKSKGKHASINISFTAIHFIIHTLLAGGIIFIADWTEKNNFGLVHIGSISPLAVILITCLVLDFFAGWLCHFVEHHVPLFWRFHIIHHADNNVDVTTGLRHHPLEYGVAFFSILVSLQRVLLCMLYYYIKRYWFLLPVLHMQM